MEATEKTPLLDILSIPPIFTQPGISQMAEQAVLAPGTTMPPCTSLTTTSNSEKDHGRKKLPQAIAHRGYKTAYPENTMGAFAGAVHIGAHAIETDVHITKDDVVVLSHDATLKRCFGRPEKLIDVDWSYVSTLQTLAEPKQYMPRLIDLLEFLAMPEHGDVWLLLDIKMDNNPDDIMRLIASTVASVPLPADALPWTSRVVLGCWATKYIPLAQKYLPGFPMTHIGFSVSYARQFLKVPNVSFNMLLPILMAPGGKKFLADCREAGRPVLAWTVNAEDKMEWCIRRGIDGVLTDDPKLFLDVCKKHEKKVAAGEEEESDMLANDESWRKGLSWRIWIDVFRIWLGLLVFGHLWRNRFAIKQAFR